MQNLLFICSRNQWRSPTAEKIYSRDERFSVRSAGTSPRARRTVSVKDIEWADVVFVMETKHRDRLKASFGRAIQHKKVVVLDIPDEYQYMDEVLVEMIRNSVEGYL